MNNKMWSMICFVCAVILAIASSIWTAKLFYGLGDGWYGYVMAGVGIALDCGKFAFPAVAMFLFKRENYAGTLVFVVMAVICVVVSFSASMSQDFNRVNEIAIEAISGSGEVQKQETIFKSGADSLATMKADLESMKANRVGAEKQIRSDYATLIENARKNRIITTTSGSVEILTKQRNAKIEKLDADILSKGNSIIEKENGLSKTTKEIEVVGKNVKTTKGIYSFAVWLNPDDPVKTTGQINLIKNILIEVCAISFSVAFGFLVGEKRSRQIVQGGGGRHANIKQDVQEIHAQPKELVLARGKSKYFGKTIQLKKPNRKIGFDTEVKNVSENIIKGIDNLDLKEYIKYTLDICKKNGEQAPGYTMVKDKITSNTHRQLMNTLKTLKYLTPDNEGKMKRTVISDREGLKELYSKL